MPNGLPGPVKDENGNRDDENHGCPLGPQKAGYG
jgi:hypothetical protein